MASFFYVKDSCHWVQEVANYNTKEVKEWFVTRTQFFVNNLNIDTKKTLIIKRRSSEKKNHQRR